MKIYILIILLFSGTINSLEKKSKSEQLVELSKQNYETLAKKRLPEEGPQFLFSPCYKFMFGGEQIYIDHHILPKDTIILPDTPPEINTVPFDELPPSALGQEADVKVISDTLSKLPKNAKAVAVGVEKGANAWINAATLSHNLNRISALVLDTACADVNEVLCRMTYFDYIPGGEFIIKQVAKFIFEYYDPDGMQPIDAIKNIQNKNLPIYIIHAKENDRISINQARKLYLKFLEYKFKNVYLVERHEEDEISLNNKGYRLYQQTLHKFFRRWGLPHKKELFAEDIKIKNFKPSAQVVMERMEQDEQEEYQKTISKTVILLFVAYACHRNFPNTSAKIQSCMMFFLRLFAKSGKIKR
ncbi:MAG: hypothetical protein P4L22_00895 [Candidatus Babeliales bacterium]|nr:hypothetical protein [Candidatus Babeliales bacterium]